MTKTIAVSVNSSWNLLNFRADLLQRLVADGYRVVALTPDDEHAARLHELGVEHVAVPIDSQGISPRRDTGLALRYWAALRRIRPVAYLGWTIKPNTYGSLAAQALGIPVINNVSGLGTAFIRQGWLTRVASTLYRLAFARSATVFFQNAADRDLFVDRRLVAARRTALLPGSGIDTTRFRPQPAPQGAPFTFLMIARLIRDKGAFEYVEAAAILKERHPHVRFDILGQLDVANRTAITRSQVKDWVARDVIRYRGQADDVRPFIAQADCVVLPSYREGMPRSLLEAAAMGKPLVATNVPGCTEIARAGENAVLCTVRDAASLAQAMEQMLELAPDARAAFGQRSREIAETEFDVSIVEARYLDAIERAITRPA
jgi:glycosyltransferase involved in cell wall biosynthesis